MILRAKELESWINDFALPNSVWLGGFFNPQSFLTAIMQQTARKVGKPFRKSEVKMPVGRYELIARLAIAQKKKD